LVGLHYTGEVVFLHFLNFLSIDDDFVVVHLQIRELAVQVFMQFIETIGEFVEAVHQQFLRLVLLTSQQVQKLIIVVIVAVHLLF
jgi:hypothetical protein